MKNALEGRQYCSNMSECHCLPGRFLFLCGASHWKSFLAAAKRCNLFRNQLLCVASLCMLVCVVKVLYVARELCLAVQKVEEKSMALL